MGKVLETLIKDRMRNHLNKYKLIIGSQHGFTKGSSCLTNLLEFCEAVSDLVDDGKAVDIVYLDNKKAFDKVLHRRLLTKVRAYGVVGQVANWIANCFSGRKQSGCEWEDVLLGGCKQWGTSGISTKTIIIHDLHQRFG